MTDRVKVDEAAAILRETWPGRTSIPRRRLAELLNLRPMTAHTLRSAARAVASEPVKSQWSALVEEIGRRWTSYQRDLRSQREAEERREQDRQRAAARARLQQLPAERLAAAMRMAHGRRPTILGDPSTWPPDWMEKPFFVWAVAAEIDAKPAEHWAMT